MNLLTRRLFNTFVRFSWMRGIRGLIVLLSIAVYPGIARSAGTTEDSLKYETREKVLVEDFGESSELVLPFELFEDAYGKAYLHEGALVIEAYTDSGLSRYIHFAVPADPDKVFMEAKLKIIHGKIGGLLFQFEDWQNYGWLLVSSSGALTVGFVQDGEPHYLVRDVPLFRYFKYGWNTIHIVQTRRVLKVYVNGYVELTVGRIPVDGNGFGFLAGGHSAIAVDQVIVGYQVKLLKEGEVAARIFGSGLILDSFHVLTAYHVVENSPRIYVTLVKKGKEDTVF